MVENWLIVIPVWIRMLLLIVPIEYLVFGFVNCVVGSMVMVKIRLVCPVKFFSFVIIFKIKDLTISQVESVTLARLLKSVYFST